MHRGLDRMLAELADLEGEIRIHHGDATHRILMRAGKVVAVRVAGRFDPLLGRLRERGALSEVGYRATLEAMATSERRSGELARMHGVERDALQHALEAQVRAALDALRRRLDASARVEVYPRRVEAREIVAFAPVPRVRSPRRATPRALPRHRALARIARELHPDRAMHLPEAERRRRERRLAHLSARLQGL